MELPPQAMGDEGRLAFRRLTKVYHPDIPTTGNVEKFLDLLWAVKILARREEMDDLLEQYREVEARTKGNRLKDDKRFRVGLDFNVEFGDWFEEVYVTPWDKAAERRLSSGAMQLPAGVAEAGRQQAFMRKRMLQQWLEQKKRRRRLRLRSKLGRASKKREPGTSEEAAGEVAPGASEDTVAKVCAALSRHCGQEVEVDMAYDTALINLGFVREYADDLMEVIMTLEEEFNVELADIVQGSIKFDLPRQVASVGDLAAFVEAKMAAA